MNDRLMRTAIEHEVRRQMDMQKEELSEALFRGCDYNDTSENFFSQMLVNAVYCSVTLAAEMAIGLLLEGGAVPRSEEELRRSLFSVCGEKDGQATDKQT